MSDGIDLTADTELSRRLTHDIRGVDGVIEVFPAAPIVEAVAEQIAIRLALHAPDVLVDIDRADGVVVTAHIGVSGARAAKETVREVGERMRDLLRQGGAGGEGSAAPTVVVRVQLVDALD